MSTNRNRAYLNKAKNGQTYHKYWVKLLYPPYWDEDYNWSRSGYKFPNYKWREYKTWKYNRKTQWKQFGFHFKSRCHQCLCIASTLLI